MSGVMTLMVAGALMIVDSTFEADTTMISSRLISGSFAGAGALLASWAVTAVAANSPRANRARRKRFIDRPPCNETRHSGPSGTRVRSAPSQTVISNTTPVRHLPQGAARARSFPGSVERPEQLLVDASEGAVGQHDHPISLA